MYAFRNFGMRKWEVNRKYRRVGFAEKILEETGCFLVLVSDIHVRDKNSYNGIRRQRRENLTSVHRILNSLPINLNYWWCLVLPKRNIARIIFSFKLGLPIYC
jgi:hypothetical protein